MTHSSEIVPMILPTVMIPLTLLSVGASVVASFIAALFGIQLKLEGPKKLLEVLLKPKVLASAFILNGLILGGVYAWRWWSNYPRLIQTIESQSQARAKVSGLKYQDVKTVETIFKSNKKNILKPEGLEQIWRIQTGKGSFRAPVISGGRIFSGNDLGVVHELDINEGSILRTFYIGTAVSSEITIWNDSMYIGEGVHDTHHARIYRFDLKSGEFKGSYQTLGHTEAQAVIGQKGSEHLLFAVGGTDGLHAIDPLTMEGRWKVNIGHMDAGILVDEGVVFIGTGREKNDDKKNKCYAAALEFETGKIIWQRELAASSWMRPVVYENNVCYIAGEIYFPTQRGHISCFDRKSGEPTIAFNTTDPLAGTPKILDHSLLYTSIHGNVCRFDLKEKKNLWCFDAKMEDFSLAGASYDEVNNVIVYPSMKTGLYVLNPDNGEVIYNWNPKPAEGEWKKTYADITVANGVWYTADDDGSVRSLRPFFDKKKITSRDE
ncbi:MAG: PQQ-binding-like beta-propeller repeat protein [Bacteriovoracaceae bacterium]|nr:PQQ-binding-like beta-propeller repeat protein [Bacteriovoracaceae bacterium]